jgi:hypothetical protein
MKPKEIMTPLQSAQAYLLDVEHELAAANDRIRLLIAERNTARLQADQKISLREEFRELLGTDDIEQGVAVVRGLQDRIKRLEEIIHRASCEFFRDGSDGQTASGMLTILEEGRKP